MCAVDTQNFGGLLTHSGKNLPAESLPDRPKPDLDRDPSKTILL